MDFTTQFDTIMLVLRLVAGPTIFWHGYNKMFKGGRIPGTAGWFDSIGMWPSGKVHAYMASVTEMGTGVLLVLGLLTPFAAAGVIGLLVVAGYAVNRKAFLVIKDGFEYDLVLATLCFGIGALGPGEWSLDNAFGLSESLNTGWRGMVIALLLGLGSGIVTVAAFYRPPPPAE